MSSLLEKMDNSHEHAVPEVESHDILHRKKIGAFYTPLTVSTALSTWGIRSVEDRVLEPCFGGCTFLEAATERLIALGNLNPERNLFGCDIDPLAFRYLETRIKPSKIAGHFFLQDFMAFEPTQLSHGKVDLVIGNPPYIRHSNFSTEQRDLLAASTRKIGVNLHGRANLWAYFVLHTLQFIKEGGRLALVLPGSFLYADYSASIRDYIHQSFNSVAALTLAERLFISEGTEETTVVLLAEGYGKPPINNDFRIKCVESVNELKTLVEKWKHHEPFSDEAYPGHGLVPADVGTLHAEIAALPEMCEISEIATIRIGLVTGNTPYFIKSRSEWKKHQIEKRYLRYILPRSQYVSGISLNESDCQAHIDKNVRCLALWTPTAPRQERLLEYLNSYPIAERENNSTFKRREIWHQFFDNKKIPDAFFVFMAEQGPRIILNQANANATNSVYRVFFNDDITSSKMKLAAVSMYTTFSQLSAEIIGHPRGSGALKLEPSGVMRLALYLPNDRNEAEIDAAFEQVSEKLRQSDMIGARFAADEFLFKEELALFLPALRSGLETIRNRRIC